MPCIIGADLAALTLDYAGTLHGCVDRSVLIDKVWGREELRHDCGIRALHLMSGIRRAVHLL